MVLVQVVEIMTITLTKMRVETQHLQETTTISLVDPPLKIKVVLIIAIVVREITTTII